MLVVDDHRTFAELLALALNAEPDIVCVGHVQEAERALDEVVRLEPDVVLVDVQLGRADGLELAADLQTARPGLRTIILSASTDSVNIARAAAAGAVGYLPKGGALDEVLSAVRTARPGRMVLDPEVLLDLVRVQQARTGPPLGGRVQLTAREQQVLELLGQGLDVTAIARRLGIRTSTCRGYVQNVLAKLGVHTQLEAVVEANARGLIRMGPHALVDRRVHD